VARKNNRRDATSPLDLERIQRGAASVIHAPDGSWVVRTVSAAGATKPYRCPGCDHEIAAGVPHVVVWPADDRHSGAAGFATPYGRIEDRRHWHTACWNARARRR
jgi:hypothetical protein